MYTHKNLLFQSPEERNYFIQILESTYRFALGSIAGGKKFNITQIIITDFLIIRS